MAEEVDFIDIYDEEESDGRIVRMIHYYGSIYEAVDDFGDGNWRDLEICWCITSLQEALSEAEGEYNGDLAQWSFDAASECKQYIGDITEDEADRRIAGWLEEHGSENRLSGWSAITADIPIGEYMVDF